jgi:hypothetical protein
VIITPLLMYVDGGMRATRLQRDHDSDVVQVVPVLSSKVYRAHAIIIETPELIRLGAAPKAALEEFERVDAVGPDPPLPALAEGCGAPGSPGSDGAPPCPAAPTRAEDHHHADRPPSQRAPAAQDRDPPGSP